MAVLYLPVIYQRLSILYILAASRHRTAMVNCYILAFSHSRPMPTSFSNLTDPSPISARNEYLYLVNIAFV